MFQNLFPTFEKSPKVEFKSFSVAHGLIRLPRSRDFFAKNFIEKAFNFDFLERKYQKLALFGFSTPVFFLQIVSKLADFLYMGVFGHGGHESEGIF